MDNYLGQIVLYPYGFIPEDCLPCDGRLLPKEKYAALQYLLKYNFGGDYKTTFALPDLRHCSPANGMVYCIVTSGVFPQQ
jgi:microcystin-dependent protein